MNIPPPKMDMYIVFDKELDNVFMGWFIPGEYNGISAPVTWIMPCCVMPFGGVRIPG